MATRTYVHDTSDVVWLEFDPQATGSWRPSYE